MLIVKVLIPTLEDPLRDECLWVNMRMLFPLLFVFYACYLVPYVLEKCRHFLKRLYLFHVV